VSRKLNGLIDAIADGLRAPGLQQRLDELEARKVELEREITTEPAPPVRLHPNLGQVYRRQVEGLQDALNEPEIRDEAIQILSGLVERIVIGPQDTGLEVEIIGEIAQMVELGLDGAKNKRAILDDKMACSVKVVAGARNHLDLQLRLLTCFAVVSVRAARREETISTLEAQSAYQRSQLIIGDKPFPGYRWSSDRPRISPDHSHALR
jgi:site-specific DNA recombinase